MLEVRGLTRRFGPVLAVDHLDLTVSAGQIFGLLGPNGAGKTTTIKLMTGLLKPSAGTVFVGGHDLRTETRDAKRLIGYVADEPHLYEKLTPAEQLQFSGEIYGLKGGELESRIDKLLRLFDLAERRQSLIESFSHGMKQKTALAAALVHDPKVLLLDEPLIGLDPRAARALKVILKNLASRGVTVLLSTHILEVAERLCDRVAILFKGRLAGLGTLAELRAKTGEDTLEEIFLEVTGGDDLEDLLASLA